MNGLVRLDREVFRKLMLEFDYQRIRPATGDMRFLLLVFGSLEDMYANLVIGKRKHIDMLVDIPQKTPSMVTWAGEIGVGRSDHEYMLSPGGTSLEGYKPALNRHDEVNEILGEWLIAELGRNGFSWY